MGSRFLLLCLLVLCAGAVHAGTIHVQLVERDGTPVPDLRVSLSAAGSLGDNAARRWVWRYHGTTDGNGRVTLQDVPPGTYGFRVRVPHTEPWVDPALNPLAASPVVTVVEEDSELSTSIVLWRGVPVTIELQWDSPRAPAARLTLQHPETGFRSEYRLNARRPVLETKLPEGRWELGLDGEAGYVLESLVRNGDELTTATAELDLARYRSAQVVTWLLAAPCSVLGNIWEPVGLRARLIEPGPWAESLQQRGLPLPTTVVPQEIDALGNYEIYLPSGVWEIAPEGELIASAEPERIEASLARGQFRRQDFVVELAEGKGGRLKRPLYVHVKDPEGVPLRGAVVEVYEDPLLVDAEPMDTDRTGHIGSATVFPAAGNLVVIAGHREWLPGRTTVEKFDPDGEFYRSATVTMRRGAEIIGQAREGGENPFAGVELSVEYLGDEPLSPPVDLDLQGDKRERTALTDQSGWAVHRGLYPGRYRVAARVRGERGLTRFARVAVAGEEPVAELELTVEEGERLELDLPVLPAATFRGSVDCDDGRGAPAAVSFRVFREGEEPAYLELPEVEDDAEDGGVSGAGAGDEGAGKEERGDDGAVVRLDNHPLSGQDADEFIIGPLEPGAYRLAMLAADAELWSWYDGQVVPGEGYSLTLGEGEALPIGHTELFCAPALQLVPLLGDGTRATGVDDAEITFIGEVATDTGETFEVDPALRETNDALYLVGLGEGQLTASIDWYHPYLIPVRTVFETGDRGILGEPWLERGDLLVVEPRFIARAGALDVSGSATAVRLTAPAVIAGDERSPYGAEPALFPLEQGAVTIPGLLPGDYTLEGCADAACARPGPARSVKVAVGQTLRVSVDVPQ